ncbi:MAG TPA: serine protease [Solirubrobacteraceae bacterium]|nr:serine protease [Solirubrobacteraceae bacterium]
MLKKSRAVIVLAGVGAALAAAAPAVAQPTWAPADDAAIAPGNMTFTDGGQCTSNFVFFDRSDNVYLGQAAHCAGTGESTDTDGCETGSLPLGTKVEVEGAQEPATLAYSSWRTMQDVGETDDDTCAFNDFALIKLDRADAAEVNPSIPFFGGPTALGADTRPGQKVLSLGNSSLRLGLDLLRPKVGTSLGEAGDGWTHNVLTVTPGVPGDSGSAFIDRDGRAFGVLSTLQLAPLAGSNGVSDLEKAVNYMEAHGGPQVNLARGTEESSRGGLLGRLLRR